MDGTNPGPKPYLTREEEAELSTHLRASSMCIVVEEYAKQKGVLRRSAISNGWWDKRNPALSLRSGDPTAAVQLDAMSASNIKSYFDLLRNVYIEFDFENHPEAIYNMDETGVPLEPRPPKVIGASLSEPHING